METGIALEGEEGMSYCSECGNKLEEGAKFCGKCGNAVEESVPQNPKKIRKSGSVIAIIFIVLILVAVVVEGIFVLQDKKEKQKYQNLLEDGAKYLEEMDYDRAETSYLKAITIDPKRSEPYLKLADIYVVQGDREKAFDILTQGRENVDNDDDASEIDSKIEEMEGYISYRWVVDPQIEADDIYYTSEGGEIYSYNEMYRQFESPYAIIRRGKSLGLIDMDGNIKGGMDYSKILSFNEEYMMEAITDGQQYTIENDEITLFEGRGYAPYAYYYNKGIQGLFSEDYTNEFFRDIPLPVKNSEEKYQEGKDGYWISWWNSLSAPYAIYYNDKLKTDFIYDECGSSSDNRMAVCKDGKWGYVNEEGEEIIPLEYDASWKDFPFWKDIDESKAYCYAYSEGYVPLCKDEQWELRDMQGRVVIPSGIFEAIRPVYDGKCWVKTHGKWGVIELEKTESKTVESEITDEMLEGIWIQDESSDAVQIIFDSNGKVKYSATISGESDYTTTYNLENNELTIKLVNMDESGVTQLKYDLSYSESGSIKMLNITTSEKSKDVDVSKLYGWDDFICGSYIQIKQEAVREQLSVPADLEVTVRQSEVSYWDAGQIYTTNIAFEKDGAEVAGATVNALTGELVKDILMYSNNTKTVTPEEIRKIVAEHYNEEHNTDEYVVYEEDCSETDEGYFLKLRTKKEHNAWVYYVMVDLTTGKVVNDIGEEWYLDLD